MIEEAIAKIEEMAIQSVAPYKEIQTVGKRTLLLTDSKHEVTVQDLEHFLEKPYQKKNTVNLSSVESFTTYVNDHKEDSTHIFGDIEKGTLRAVLDYHHRGEDGDPSWGHHVCVLTLPASKDWQAWEGHDGKGFGQTAFAEFLEDMDHTIIEPDAARIIEIVEKLKITQGCNFESSVNRQSGAMHFTYTKSSDQTKDQVKLPEKFEIQVAPYMFCKSVPMLAFLRYRLADSKLSIFYKLHRPDLIKDEAFQAVLTQVTDEVGLPVLMV